MYNASRKLLPTPKEGDWRSGKQRRQFNTMLNVEITRQEIPDLYGEPPQEKHRETIPQLPLLPADSLASLLVLPGSEEARKMTVTSGQR